MLGTLPACQPIAVQPLVNVLDQLFRLLAVMTDQQYTQKPVGVVRSSIGGHIRHNLDHVEALLLGLGTGEINYDHRERDTVIEHSRSAAMQAIIRLEDQLLLYPWEECHKDMMLTMLVAPDSPTVVIPTTVDRELAFVLSHTIHHNALIAVIAQLLQIPVPADFGYAPSTIAYQRSRSCVR